MNIQYSMTQCNRNEIICNASLFLNFPFVKYSSFLRNYTSYHPIYESCNCFLLRCYTTFSKYDMKESIPILTHVCSTAKKQFLSELHKRLVFNQPEPSAWYLFLFFSCCQYQGVHSVHSLRICISYSKCVKSIQRLYTKFTECEFVWDFRDIWSTHTRRLNALSQGIVVPNDHTGCYCGRYIRNNSLRTLSLEIIPALEVKTHLQGRIHHKIIKDCYKFMFR